MPCISPILFIYSPKFSIGIFLALPSSLTKIPSYRVAVKFNFGYNPDASEKKFTDCSVRKSSNLMEVIQVLNPLPKALSQREAVNTRTKKKKLYLENLDGLRFLCFLCVFFYHSFGAQFDYIKQFPAYGFIRWGIFRNGNLGVNFFFVLSGFLITYLLLKEKKLNGQIDLKKFWIRRILRIWPLFYFCVLFGFYCFPALKLLNQQPSESASIGYYLTFTNNFDYISKGKPDSNI